MSPGKLIDQNANVKPPASLTTYNQWVSWWFIWKVFKADALRHVNQFRGVGQRVIMEDTKVINGLRGVEYLVWGGFLYSKKRVNVNTVMWRCRHYKKLQCSAQIKTGPYPVSLYINLLLILLFMALPSWLVNFNFLYKMFPG